MTTTQARDAQAIRRPPPGQGQADPSVLRLLSVIATAGALANLGLMALRLVTAGQFDINVGINGAFLATSLLVLWLLRSGRPRAAAQLLLWGGWGLNTAFVWMHGGVHNVNWTTFLVLISGAAWMLGQRTTLLMTGATAALYGLAAWAEGRGWVGTPVRDSEPIVAFYFCIMFALAAAMGLAARHSYRLRIDRERRTSAELAEREFELRKFSQVIEQSPEGVLITDTRGRVEYANPAALSRLGRDADEALGADVLSLGAMNLDPDSHDAILQTLACGQAWRGELRGQHVDGRVRIEATRVSPLRQPDGSISHHVWLRQDITARREAEARLHHLARHDPITGLPNRSQLEERLVQTLRQARLQGRLAALVHLNIDRFKTINEARGQAAGDALLRALGARLSALAGSERLVARLGTDEFAALLPDLDADAATASRLAYAFASQMQDALLEPLTLDSTGDQVTVSTSIGIALCPDGHGQEAGSGGHGAAQVLRHAATALNQAKARGGAQIAFFELAMGDAAEQRFRIDRDLRQALVDDQLRLYLQPQVDTSGRWTGAEALVRWQHPVQGLVSPGVFIPIAEESDLIVGLGRWVVTEAMRLIAEQARAGRSLPLSINLSPRQFRQPDFVTWMQQLLAEHAIDPHLLTLEITEGLVIGNVEQTIERMQALRALGLHFSIDDFGTGYSSLAYLKRLPISELKIDRSFIQDVTRRADDAALVETILSVACHMGLKVVAEGVEEPAQTQFLAARAEGVILQGYFYGRPGPAEEWLARWVADGSLPTLPALPPRQPVRETMPAALID